jgi:hypothetical protein
VNFQTCLYADEPAGALFYSYFIGTFILLKFQVYEWALITVPQRYGVAATASTPTYRLGALRSLNLHWLFAFCVEDVYCLHLLQLRLGWGWLP